MPQAATPMAIRTVPGVAAGFGLRWWSDAAAALFGGGRRILPWILMTVIFLASHVLDWLPLGGVVSFLLNFLFAGGFMLAAEKTRRDGDLHVADLFSAFGAHGGTLLGLGLIVLLFLLGIAFLVAVAGVGSLVASLVTNAMDAPLGGDFPLAGITISWAAIGAMLMGLLLLVPLSMAAWFAPALVVLRSVNPVDALRLSLVACLRNFGALTVYSLVALALLVPAGITIVGMLIYLPLLFLSTHAAFHDLYTGGLEVLEPAQAARTP